MKEPDFKFSTSVVAWPLYFVLLLWVVFWIEVKFGFRLVTYGIYPREVQGLRGVFLSPFIHGDLEHLYNNSIPLLMLMAALRFFYRDHALKVIVFGIIGSGLLTWIIARESYHIGASGLVYVLVSFIFFKGIQTQYYRLVALSLTIIFVYGGLVWYVFPDVEEGISWEGHLAGFIVGFVFSLIFDASQYKKPIRYDWERPDFDPSKDAFMKRFDAEGRFVNPPPPIIEEETNFSQHSTLPFAQVVYHVKSNQEISDPDITK